MIFAILPPRTEAPEIPAKNGSRLYQLAENLVKGAGQKRFLCMN
jgi:hypothetical protein